MNVNFFETDDDKKKSRRKKSKPKNQFFKHLVGVLIFFAAISLLYSFVADERTEKGEEIALSEVAQGIVAGEVESIVVKGNDLEIKFISADEIRPSKKEPESSKKH